MSNKEQPRTGLSLAAILGQQDERIEALVDEVLAPAEPAQKPQRERIVISPPVPGLVGPIDPQQIVGDLIRNVAEAANRAGLDGKRVVGMAFDNLSAPLPVIILHVELPTS